MPGRRSRDKRHVSAYIPSALHARLRALARRRGVTDTRVVVEALTEWLDRNETAGTAPGESR